MSMCWLGEYVEWGNEKDFAEWNLLTNLAIYQFCLRAHSCKVRKYNDDFNEMEYENWEAVVQLYVTNYCITYAFLDLPYKSKVRSLKRNSIKFTIYDRPTFSGNQGVMKGIWKVLEYEWKVSNDSGLTAPTIVKTPRAKWLQTVKHKTTTKDYLLSVMKVHSPRDADCYANTNNNNKSH